MATNQTLSLLITLSILVNTFVIFSDKYPQTLEEIKLHELLNNIFYAVFVSELLVKMLGLGVLNYIRDSYNIFDTLIIIFSTIELGLA